MNKIIIKVPAIMKSRGLDFNDLHYGARIALNTAKRWTIQEEADQITNLQIDTLEKIAEFLQLDVGEMIGFE